MPGATGLAAGAAGLAAGVPYTESLARQSIDN